ncbi:MAG: DUF423 domain-containing protein [Pirellulales bacterium]|nr:DUF423 domain-containing protein [Pirellulales bacterium]
MIAKVTVCCGIILAGLAVGLGAFGAHGWQELLIANGRVDTFETAVRYLMYHALGLILFGLMLGILGSGKDAFARDSVSRSDGWAIAIAVCFVMGSLIFSGSLLILSLSNIRWLGAITPIGGVLQLAGWGLWLVWCWRGK